ncbi:MAG: c-type cytochrome [Steroidobacteraceae bacterium]
MSDRIRNLVLLLGFGALSAAAPAADKASEGQLAHGRKLALAICSACHVVASDQEFSPLLNPPAPPFADIANRAESTRAALRHFVSATHWDEKSLPLTMPNPSLTDSQIADVVAYILSLRKS